jgi:uncharacterized protein (TIGR02246 family)
MLAIATVLVAVGGTVSVTSADTMDDITTAVEAWAGAYNSHDPVRVLARYHPEAAFWGTSSPLLRTTPEAIVDYFSSLSRRPNAHVAIGERNVRIVGAAAIVTGSYTFTDVTDGEMTVRPARFSFVFENVSGEWLLVQHHSSRTPD